MRVGPKNESESQADRFAAKSSDCAPEDFARLAERTRFTKAGVKASAEEVGVCPGIVVGRLRHEKLLPPSHLNDSRSRFSVGGVAMDTFWGRVARMARDALRVTAGAAHGWGEPKARHNDGILPVPCPRGHDPQ